MSSRLLPLLARRGWLAPGQVDEAVARSPHSLAVALIEAGWVDEEQVFSCLREELELPEWCPGGEPVPAQITGLIPAALARRLLVVPIALSGGTLSVAMVDPSDASAMREIKFAARYEVKARVARLSHVRAAIEHHYLARPERGEDPAPLPSASEPGTGADAPVIRLVQAILSEAVRSGASDVHIEPSGEALRVRYRCDGLLREVLRPPRHLKNAIGSRIKILGDLDIAERRLPQDGRLRLPVSEGKAVDVRISVLPTLHGEKTVLRILDSRRTRLQLDQLGLDPSQLNAVRQALRRPHGLILVTGPTGSGKSTSLYAALSELNRESRNILTAEDPVELEISGVNQVPINEEIGLSFAAALRAFLRQDPDVIMVGEIRDADTASVAVKAALTGHLVLSTLHTNDTVASISRLVNMGVEPYLLAACLVLVVAQRLVRRRCESCHVAALIPGSDPTEPEPSTVDTRNHGRSGDQACPRCQGSGYRGRLAIYEVLPASDTLRALITRAAGEDELRRAARAEGMCCLRESGMRRVRAGLTSAEEILGATVA